MTEAGASWMERHQVPFYLAGLGIGAAVGLLVPAVESPAQAAVLPVLAVLLYATFLGIPMARIGRTFADWKFLSTILVVNFVVVPAVVWVLSRSVAHDQVLLVGMLFVLLTPCIDYVIVFAGLAGGNEERLLVASPLLMLVQMLLLPLYLWFFIGSEFVDAVEFTPFIEAFVLIIALPLAAAVITQVIAARSRSGRAWQGIATGTMIPLMAVTLAVVVASQIAGVRAQLSSLLVLIPIYILFAVVMVPIGAIAGRVAGLDEAGRRTVVFSGVTRNSLVVLPLVLALPRGFELAPLVVVTQTLVELTLMVVFVRLIPRVIPLRPAAAGPTLS